MSTFVPLAALRKATVSSPWTSPVLEGGAGDIAHFGVFLESLDGAPTAASLAAKFQVRPIQANGVNLNCESDAVARPWLDVVAGDGKLGHMLIDGDFPAVLADQTYPRTATGSAAPYMAGIVGFERRFRFGAWFNQVRLVLTPTFTGGTAPSFTLTAGAAVQPHFGN